MAMTSTVERFCVSHNSTSCSWNLDSEAIKAVCPRTAAISDELVQLALLVTSIIMSLCSSIDVETCMKN